MRRATLFLLLALQAACAVPAPLVSFDRTYRRNYLVLHSGTVDHFLRASCLRVSHAEDSSRAINAPSYLRSRLREQLPALHECRAAPEVSVEIEYFAGPGVSIHGVMDPRGPQSGYAWLTVRDETGAKVADAEWQYWRGGTPQHMVQQFIFDLTNLVVHGLPKPAA